MSPESDEIQPTYEALGYNDSCFSHISSQGIRVQLTDDYYYSVNYDVTLSSEISIQECTSDGDKDLTQDEYNLFHDFIS